MADDLKLDRAASRTRRKSDNQPSDTRPEVAAREGKLARLKEVFKKNLGEDLPRSQLEQIIEQVEAKRAYSAGIDRSKRAFAADQSSSRSDAESRAKTDQSAKTTGAQQARNAKDGLTQEQRQSIQSDPKARPTLPPTGTSPIKAKQAEGVLRRVLAPLIAANGEAMGLTDLEGRARERRARQRNARTQPGRSSSSRGPGALSLRLRGNTAAQGAKTPVAHDQDGLAGIETYSSFEGMSFNWEAFFALFLIRSEKDAHLWRRALRDLKRQEERNALMAHEVKASVTQMRHEFEKLQKTVDFVKSTESLHRAMDRGRLDHIGGRVPINLAQTQQKLAKQWNEARQKGRGSVEPALVPGQSLLTPSQLASLMQQAKTNSAARALLHEYEQAMDVAQRYGGLTGVVGWHQAEAARQRAAGNKEEAAALEETVSEDRDRLAREVRVMAESPQDWRELVDRRRRRMLGIAQQARAKGHADEEARWLHAVAVMDDAMAEARPVNPNLRAQGNREADRMLVDMGRGASGVSLSHEVLRERMERLRDDPELKPATKTDIVDAEDRLHALNREAGDRLATRLDRDPTFRQTYATAARDVAQAHGRALDELQRKAGVETPEGRALGYVQSQLDALAGGHQRLVETPLVDRPPIPAADNETVPTNLQALRSRAAGMERFHRVDSDFRPTTAAAVDTGEKVARGADTVAQALRQSADTALKPYVDEAVEQAIQFANQHRQQVDGMIRSNMRQAEGMLEQLLQVLAMARRG